VLPLSENPLRDSAGEAEYEDDISGDEGDSQFLTAAWTLPTGRRVIFAAMCSVGSGGRGEFKDGDIEFSIAFRGILRSRAGGFGNALEELARRNLPLSAVSRDMTLFYLPFGDVFTAVSKNLRTLRALHDISTKARGAMGVLFLFGIP
jgi:hypothetical protein